VAVTAWYMHAEPRRDFYAKMDAANVDLKAFTEGFYRKVTLTHLEPVLETLLSLSRLGVWVEITTLLIPTLNDDMTEIRELSRWVLEHLGAEQPLHFTAFHPDFKLTDLPATPHETLHEARRVALEAGLKHVYEGNVRCEEGSTTWCPRCGEALIRRSWHDVIRNALTQGRCRCGRPLAGLFPEAA